MALTKSTTVDQITVTENGIILYREATRIMEDGNELSKAYHRSSLTPGQDLTEAIVIGWIPEQATASAQACVQGQIDSMITPPVSPQNTPLPWSA